MSTTTTVTNLDIHIAKAKEIFEAALAELPTTGEAIAAFFAKEKISGGHGAHNCPVANYIKAKLTAAGLPNVKVSVSSYNIILWEGSDPDHSLWEVRYFKAGHQCVCVGCDLEQSNLRFDAAIADFITEYDGDKYPNLDARLAPLRAFA